MQKKPKGHSTALYAYPTGGCGHNIKAEMTANVVVVVSVFLLLLVAGASCGHHHIGEERGVPTNSWAVEILGGDRVADEVAKDHGFINRGRVSC